jgi:hypothetical protein
MQTTALVLACALRVMRNRRWLLVRESAYARPVAWSVGRVASPARGKH